MGSGVEAVGGFDEKGWSVRRGRWAGGLRRLNVGGYDPVFLDIASGKTGAEISVELKNQISHRGQALQQLIQKLKVKQS